MQQTDASLTRIRILLVGDNPSQAERIRIALSEVPNRHYEITASTTLEAALRLAKSTFYDAVLLPLHVPDSTDLANIRELALATPHTAIVVIARVNDDALAVGTCEHGAEAYLARGDDDPLALSLVIRCAIARKRFEAVLAQQAYFDSLTGLANRGLFNDRLKHAMARAARTDNRVGLLFVDLDRFKSVNDRLGHQAGDEVLRSVAEALRRVVRQTDTVARLGGDEFTVLVEPLENARDADLVARRILRAVQSPITVGNEQVKLTVSIGIAVFPEDARIADALIESADAAMFSAKRDGGNKLGMTTPNR